MKSLIGNKVAEKEIRDWLSENGYFGGSAEFRELELHAIQPQGWLQIFRFGVRAKCVEGAWHELYGAMRDDQRYGPPVIGVYEDVDERNAQLTAWSERLISSQRPKGRGKQ